jgi:sulfur carrier protein ThiS adenylyltransferase
MSRTSCQSNIPAALFEFPGLITGVNADRHAELKIGIAGMGGIGSNVAWNLIRAGVFFLRIVDFDTVEVSNLDRQFYFADQVGQRKVDASKTNLERIAPRCTIETFHEKLTIENIRQRFEGMDVLIEGFDDPDAKTFLFDAFLNYPAEKPIHLVSACGVAGNEIANITVRQLANALIVGDFSSHVTSCDSFAFSPKINVIAAMMAAIALNKVY